MTSSLDGYESDESGEIVFNEEFLEGFIGMEGGHVKRNARTLAKGPAANVSALPQREDEASRAAQLEARQQRQQQDMRYGARVAEMRALEASLNERFDSISQAHAPVLWPSVPFS